MGNRQIEQNEKMVDIYVEEDRRDNVKECFKFLKQILSEQLSDTNKTISLCDVGCATGDLLWYLQKSFKEKMKLYGIDVSESLLEVARVRLPHIDFMQRDIMSASDFSQKFDAVTCFGVLSLFEDWESFLRNLCKMSRGGGTLLCVHTV